MRNHRFFFILLLLTVLLYEFSMPLTAAEPENLHAAAAVLMDAESGRVLFEKNGTEKLPMASTTKIMTLLIALENADPDGIVTVSSRAASMPEVKLHIREGERYRLLDLLYSLILESHNDTAVAIAEHIGGSVEQFASMMNQKARDLGCFDTYFITPNGLDAQDEHGIHSTTAKDLARIMRFCIRNEDFLAITRTASHSFSDLDGTRNFTVQNKNAFLNMMDGVLSGKTGFTGNAGYCYVGAMESGGKRLISVVLACGWPGNRTWKWQDTTKLMNYGLSDFEIKTFGDEIPVLAPVPVQNGRSSEAALSVTAAPKELLCRKEDTFSMDILIPDTLTAPVTAGEMVGTVVYYLNGSILDLFPVTVCEDIPAIDFRFIFRQVTEKWLPGISPESH